MTGNKANKILFLFWLGVFSFIYAFGIGFVFNDFLSFFSTKVVILTGTMCFLVVCLNLNKNFIAGSGRKVLIVIKSVLYFGLLVAALILVNVLSLKKDFRFDLTKAKQHSLSESTKNFIRNLSQEIKITAFYTGIAPRYLEDMLKEYEKSSNGMIKAEIIDPVIQIGYAAQFGHIINAKESKVIIQSLGPARLKKEIDFSDSILTEEQLTNEIIRVTRKEVNVYFLIGNGELDINDEAKTGISEFVKMLSSNNMIVHTILLGEKSVIPDNCDVLIVAGPKDNLTPDEVRIIKEYLLKGGDALFLIEDVRVSTPDKPLTKDEFTKNPSLNEIFGDWGIEVATDVVVDLINHAGEDVGSPATKNYLSHRAIVKDLDYTFYVRPRSIGMTKNRRETIKLAPLVVTESAEKSWGETDRYLNVKYDVGIDAPGPVPLAFVIWEPKAGSDLSDTRMVVFTDADFLSNSYLKFYSNAEMGVNCVNWLSELDYQVFIDKKNIEVARLDLTSQQKKLVVIVLVLMPVLIVLLGISMWIGRKIE